MMLPENSTILTGIKPTGHPHLGNYAGMISPTLSMVAENKTGRNFLFIANYHALNSMDSPELLAQYTYEIAACFLALGLDIGTTRFYRQSDIPEIFELATILSATTPKGLMNRAHAYKAKLDEIRGRGSSDKDEGINMGLYTYPILMAADILLFDADVVPVGKDQVQHVEFARDIAGFFNRKYEVEALRMPRHLVQEEFEALPGIDGRKMSKSYGNTIPLFAGVDAARKSINKIVTDSLPPEAPKDANGSIIFSLYRAISSHFESEAFRRRFEDGGLGYGAAKRLLTEKFEERFADATLKYKEYLADRHQLEMLMKTASADAREQAREKLRALRLLIGVR